MRICFIILVYLLIIIFNEQGWDNQWQLYGSQWFASKKWQQTCSWNCHNGIGSHGRFWSFYYSSQTNRETPIKVRTFSVLLFHIAHIIACIMTSNCLIIGKYSAQKNYFSPVGWKNCEKVSPYFSLSGVEKCLNLLFWGKNCQDLNFFGKLLAKFVHFGGKFAFLRGESIKFVLFWEKIFPNQYIFFLLQKIGFQLFNFQKCLKIWVFSVLLSY